MITHLAFHFRPSTTLSALVGLLAITPGRGEIEADLGKSEYLLAINHSPPEAIVPGVPHHHHHAPGHERGHHHHEDAHEQGLFEFAFSVGADSRYVSEGRDNLDDGGILWANATGHVHALGGAFFGDIVAIQAWDDNYQEFDFAAGYEREIGSVTLAAAVTYLRFPQEDGDQDDVEIAFGAEWVSEIGVGVAAEAVWSVDAEGWFGETVLFYQWELAERLTLVPAVALGINQGYVDDEHDGFNHLGLQLEGVVPLSDHIEAVAYAAYIEPLDDEDGESLRDLFWVGGSLTFTF